MVFVKSGIEALLFAHVDALKMAPSRSLAAGQTYVRQLVSGIQHQGWETPCSCFVRQSASPTHYLTYTRLLDAVRSTIQNHDANTRHEDKFLALSLNGEESLLKLNNSRIQIRIRIFTKIESIFPCHTPNMSTKFHPNPSTTFKDIVLYIMFGPISRWWRIT